MYLACASIDLKIYNCEKWNLQCDFIGNSDPVKEIKWCYDAKHMLQVNDTVQILCFIDNKIKNVQDVQIKEPTCGTFYHDSIRNLAVGTSLGTTHIWDTKLRKKIKTFDSPSSSKVKLLDLNQKNTILGTALENGDTLLYSIGSNTLLSTIKVPFSNSVSSLSFHKEFRSILALATDEGSVLIKDFNLNKDKMFLKNAHMAPVTGIVFSPINKDVMISCSLDKKLNIYDTRLQTIVSTIMSNKFLSCVDLSYESYVGIGTKNGEVLIYDLRNYRKALQTLKDHKSAVNCVKFQPHLSNNRKMSFNFSLKEIEVNNARSNVTKSPKNANFSDLWEYIKSPPGKNSFSSVKNLNDFSQDSFLDKIIDQTSQSIQNDSMQNEDFQVKLKPQNKESKSTSTPIDFINGRLNKMSQSEINWSPIINNEEIEIDNNTKSLNLSHKKSIDIPDSTLKFSPNYLTDLTKELKNHLDYSLYDIISDHRSYYMGLTLQQIKNNMFLVDQLALINKQLQSLQKSMQNISEDNKKIFIEIEMLRTKRKL